MNNNELRKIFNEAIKYSSSKDTIAKLEICREYFTNPEFKRGMEDYVSSINRVKKGE